MAVNSAGGPALPSFHEPPISNGPVSLITKHIAESLKIFPTGFYGPSWILSGHYTASINCCGKIYHYNDHRITECNIMDTYNSSTVYMLLYKLIIECKGSNMSRRTFVVAGIVECLQPDCEG